MKGVRYFNGRLPGGHLGRVVVARGAALDEHFPAAGDRSRHPGGTKPESSPPTAESAVDASSPNPLPVSERCGQQRFARDAFNEPLLCGHGRRKPSRRSGFDGSCRTPVVRSGTGSCRLLPQYEEGVIPEGFQSSAQVELEWRGRVRFYRISLRLFRTPSFSPSLEEAVTSTGFTASWIHDSAVKVLPLTVLGDDSRTAELSGTWHPKLRAQAPTGFCQTGVSMLQAVPRVRLVHVVVEIPWEDDHLGE
ncbi:hypothetical protein AXG93_3457s1430 [Marchantia polymorpha subsp. ruderalis]|uniref:Uncharacterized protein n=1 Tax=Marchantia polymorpha subsp. ruderalis TaxID=1480154 RepID=A0A176W1Y1_MARPO|nr:hypothetical protein AXG93_3457s1430 [Marchantia polymorpha subsp. ruderalis]